MVRRVDDILDHRVNANVEPLAEHAACSALGPLARVRGPADEPIVEEVVEVLSYEALDFLDGVEIWTEEDRKLISRFGDCEPRTVVERIRPVCVRLLGDNEDRRPIEACDTTLRVAS